MIDLKNKTYEQLIEIQRNSVPGGDIYEQTTQEINRIQQDTNNIQIAKLIDETRTLKEITEKNARSGKWLSIIAIVIALVALFIK